VFAVTHKDAIEVQSPLVVVGLFHLNHWRQILAHRREGLIGTRTDVSEMAICTKPLARRTLPRVRGAAVLAE
jgi:hypothetical protein